ncbi:hypothetical protein I350_06391 [Cryptococcus amylolentus CBS 6273]|uniref:Mid2 domain-containing protein n=1 Tax=Cryptococcus amylolentus CBS 6273 TaxID=1296118 RepID=A0A1E3JL26_9TREE|nr:hypothetical protein I350_06391 [Cryptococcus amylolentus CBS 6273]
MPLPPSLLYLVVFGLLAGDTSAFSFITSTPSQCGNFTVQWAGGTAPFYLLFVPVSGHINNITIPDGLSSPYSYSFTLDQPAGLDFMLAMSDSTGFGSGGSTSVLTVGSSDESSCLPSSVNADFYFSIDPDSNPSACSSMSVTWPSNTTDPTHLYGIIPYGSAWEIPIDDSGTSQNWTVNIASGTQFLLLMSDAGQYQTGGSTDLYTVQSGSTDCLGDDSPTSASGGTTSTSSASGSTASVSGVGGSSSGGSDDSSSGGSSSSHTGAIVGGTVGGVAFVVLLGLSCFFFLRRQARQKADAEDISAKPYSVTHEKAKRRRTVDLGSGDEQEAEERNVEGEVYQLSPFRYPSPPDNVTPGAVPETAPRPTQEGKIQPFVAPSSTRPSNESAAAASPPEQSAQGSSEVERRASTRKTAPTASANALAAASNHENRQSVVAEEPERRLMQHEDAGQVE